MKKLLTNLLVTGALWTAGVMFHGIMKYPSAPIRQVSVGYVDKQGDPRTPQEYEDFSTWKALMFGSGAVLLVVGALLVVVDKRSQ